MYVAGTTSCRNTYQIHIQYSIIDVQAKMQHNYS